MRTIHKHVLHTNPGRQTIRTSFAARVLHVASQTDEDTMSVWFDLDKESPQKDRHFEFFLTGGFPPDGAEYISTHLLNEGRFVLHLFEVQA